jgi:hypothetical protein
VLLPQAGLDAEAVHDPLGFLASDDLIMMCFLEYEPARVRVHDLIWVREPDGWRLRKGAYRKLRLGPDAVTTRLVRAGFTVEPHQAPAGVVALVAVSARPRPGQERGSWMRPEA